MRFLESQDTTFQHIAIWTLVQLLESGGESEICSKGHFVPQRRAETLSGFS